MKYIGKNEIIEYQDSCSKFAQSCLHEIIEIVSSLPNQEIFFNEDLDNAYAFVVERNEISSVVEVRINHLCLDDKGLAFISECGDRYYSDDIDCVSIVYPDILYVLYKNINI